MNFHAFFHTNSISAFNLQSVQ